MGWEYAMGLFLHLRSKKYQFSLQFIQTFALTSYPDILKISQKTGHLAHEIWYFFIQEGGESASGPFSSPLQVEILIFIGSYYIFYLKLVKTS